MLKYAEPTEKTFRIRCRICDQVIQKIEQKYLITDYWTQRRSKAEYNELVLTSGIDFICRRCYFLFLRFEEDKNLDKSLLPLSIQELYKTYVDNFLRKPISNEDYEACFKDAPELLQFFKEV